MTVILIFFSEYANTDAKITILSGVCTCIAIAVSLKIITAASAYLCRYFIVIIDKLVFLSLASIISVRCLICVCKSEFGTLVKIQCFSLKPPCPRMEGYRNVKEDFLWLAACYLMEVMERNGAKRVLGWKVAGDGGGKAGFSYSEYGRRKARCLLSCPMLTSTSTPSSLYVCVCVCVRVFSLMLVCTAARFLPLSHPITVHTPCLNTNTPHCRSPYSCQSVRLQAWDDTNTHTLSRP